MLTLLVLNGCGKWSVPLREQRSRVSENRVPRKTGGHCIVRRTMICTFHKILFGWSNRTGGACGALGCGGKGNCIESFGGEHIGKRTFGKARLR